MPKTITQLPAASSADRGAVVAADNAAGTLTQRVTLGQIADLAPPIPSLNPPGMARMVTVKSSDDVSIAVKSTTGYVAARWWDGSVQVFGSGVAGDAIAVSKAVPTSGNWSKSAPKEFFVWSCTAANATQSGNLTHLDCYGNQLTSLDVSGLTALTSLGCYGNQLTSLDVSGLTALTYLNCSINQLTSLDVSGLTALTGLNCETNPLTSIRAVGVSLNNDVLLSGNTSLSAAALNQFYTDLAPGNGTIQVYAMPNATTSDNPSIATAKGYTVIGGD